MRTAIQSFAGHDPRLTGLYEYWLSIQPVNGLLPARRDFDPVDVPQVLPWLWLVDVQREPLRFKYRLIGTELVAAIGHNATGKCLDEVHPRFTSSAGYQQLVNAATLAEVGFLRGSATYDGGRSQGKFERLILPLATNGREVDMLLGLTVFIAAKPLAARMGP
jgi:hypothetical protein